MADVPVLAFLSLGSNIDPGENLPAATRALRRLGTIIEVSPAMESPAWGPTSQPSYVNAAVLLQTQLSPVDLRARLRAIEASLGRVRTLDKFAPRGIDIDLCLYGSSVMEGPVVTIPDPAILERPYLCVTLAAVSPEFPHPVTGETLRSIARRMGQDADLRSRPGITAAIRRAAGLAPEPPTSRGTEADDQG